MCTLKKKLVKICFEINCINHTVLLLIPFLRFYIVIKRKKLLCLYIHVHVTCNSAAITECVCYTRVYVRYMYVCECNCIRWIRKALFAIIVCIECHSVKAVLMKCNYRIFQVCQLASVHFCICMHLYECVNVTLFSVLLRFLS